MTTDDESRTPTILQFRCRDTPVRPAYFVSTSSEKPNLTRALEFAFEAHEQAHALIGPYKLLEKIGEGGFGVAWMAEQQEPVLTLPGPVSSFSGATAFSADGNLFGTLADQRLHLWRAPSWEQIAAAEDSKEHIK